MSQFLYTQHYTVDAVHEMLMCACICAFVVRQTKVTQAYPVSAGVNGLSYNEGCYHDQRGYKATDDGTCVYRGGC